nr:integrase, catalytic region, zinc finger, CCHC-type, peptidase aspartic, catalytic [Tanacetum cinerariifolium]
MSNTNNTLQTQTLNVLHNAIMEAGGKDQGGTETTTERYMENYKNVSQDIRDQLNAEAETVQIILTWIDNDIYSTVDVCPNACEMWKAIERLKQGTTVMQKSRIQCYNCKEYGHVARECQKLKRAKDAAYHKEKMLLSHYIYMAHIQEVNPYATDNSGPIFDSEPLQKGPNNDNYNVFAIESEHPEQSKSVHDTYLIEQDEHNMIIDSLDMRYDREQVDQDDDDDDIANERDLLASLIEKLKCEIDDSKNRNKFLETSNKALVDKLKVIRQPNAFKSQRPSILEKPTIFSNSLERKDCSKSKSYSPTSVSRPHLKSNQIKDRVMLNNSQEKKLEVEDHRRNVKFSKNKTSLTACVHSRTTMPMVVPVSTREPKRIVNQSVATPLRKTVPSKSTNQKPRYTTRKLYEHVTKTCSWWYPKFTPPEYKWKPKSQIGNVNPYVCMPLGNASRTANILEPMTPRHSTVSITTLYSNSFAACRDYPIHRRLWGNDLLTGSRGIELYSITLQDTSSPNLICLMAKATSSQAWLWHRRLSHLNFDTINLLSKNDIVIGLPKLKFVKDHLCSSCELGNAKQKSFQTKTTPSSRRRLVQRGLHAQVRIVQTDKGMEFLNKTLHAYFASEGINHQTSIARTPKQNGVVERWNRTLVEMASDHVSFNLVPKCPITALEHDSLSLGPQSQENVPQVAGTVTMSNELDLLFSLIFDELLNESTQVVSKSSIVTTADAPNQCQQQHTTPSTTITVAADTTPLNTQTTLEPTCQDPTQAPFVTSTENINQAKTITKSTQVEDDKFINIFCTPRHPSEHRWMKDHPLEQVIGNLSQSIRSRCQLDTDGKMSMFALTMSRTKPKNIKEAIADSAWIESMHEELHQFDRLDIHQSPRGIFINQAKYAQEILIKHEAEYVSLSACCTQVLWLRTQLTDYGFHFDKIPMYYDSKAAIAISCNQVQHSRTKHIDVRYHFIKEKVEKGIVE